MLYRKLQAHYLKLSAHLSVRRACVDLVGEWLHLYINFVFGINEKVKKIRQVFLEAAANSGLAGQAIALKIVVFQPRLES